MSVKRGKITADKARERITILEESIQVREQKLEHLRSKLSRMPEPEEKLLRIEERLSNRLELEREQLQKLKRLLSRQNQPGSIHDSSELYGNEELDELHRSFEEVRHDLSQVKHRLESTDIPRDLPGRLNSFEERLNRREEADSGVFSQLLALQNSLDQERETIRKMSRRLREQEQSIEALREAVEDSVVATVDLAERLDELEETPDDSPRGELNNLRREVMERLEELQVGFQETLDKLSDWPDSSGSTKAELELLMDALNDFDARLEELEGRAEVEPIEESSEDESEPSESVLFVGAVEQLTVRRVSASPTAPPLSEQRDIPSSASPHSETDPTTTSTQPGLLPAPVPAVFVTDQNRGSLVPAKFSNGPRQRAL